jgi:hypothetical protein
MCQERLDAVAFEIVEAFGAPLEALTMALGRVVHPDDGGALNASSAFPFLMI